MNTSPPPNGHALGEGTRRAGRSWKTTISLGHVTAQLVLVAIVTVTPWLFGGVQAAVQRWLFVAVAVALVCWFVKQRTANAALPVGIVPLSCGLGLGLLQLVPLDAHVNAALSPAGARLCGALLSEETGPDVSLAMSAGVGPGVERRPLSLYPASTRHDLALFVLPVAVFALGATFFKTPRAQLWLCSLVALNGAALSFFGLVQQIRWNGLLYWTVPLTKGGAPFGPFVNRNNCGGFLNLCLAAAVGMTVWVVGRDRAPDSDRRTTCRHDRQHEQPLPARARRRLTELVARLDALTIVALSLTACIIGGILCSFSRGAGVAMIGAAIVTILLARCARRGALRLGWIGLAAAAGMALVSWVGMSDSVHTRFATLLDNEAVSQDRIAHWRDGLKAAADFWRLGSGLGTYRYVYRPYQERFCEAWFYHADNQYLEVFVEAGIAGLALVLIMIGVTGVAAWCLLRDAPHAGSFAVGMVGIFALSSQVIHGFFDFGLYLPANALLFALFCGAVSGRVADLARRGATLRLLALPRVHFLTTFLAASLFGATLWGYLETRDVAAVEKALKSTRFEHTPTGATAKALQDAIGRMSEALKHREDDAQAQCRMADLWVHLYRVRALETLRRETPEDADDSRLWQITSPVVLHGRAHQFAQSRRWSALEQLRSEPVISNHLRHALGHLVLARRCCALLPDVHLMIATLCVLSVDPSGDQIHLHRLRRLAPGDPDLLFRCGVLEMNAGRRHLAYQSWRRSLVLSPRHLEEILRIVDGRLIQPGTIEKLLPDSPKFLLQLARERYQGDAHADIRRALARRAQKLIGQGDFPEDEQYYLRGSALALRERYPQAIANYSRAVELRWRDARWRYELALLLKREDRIDEAHDQARLCVRMAPNNREYRTLLEEINRTRLNHRA